MNTQLYTEILRGDFVKILGDYELDMSESTFQQDNDPKFDVDLPIILPATRINKV